MLSGFTHVICQTNFLSLIFQQLQNIYVSHVAVAKELERCCVLFEAGARTHPESRVLRLLFGMTALPVSPSYVWSVAIIEVHCCCVFRVRKPSPNAFPPPLSRRFTKNIFGIIL